ncbi:MAG TPA: hypothetical protein GXZ26_07530 [Firmicutes bacterium]|nr:hypothetical protein [Bacillota bacterium]
MKDHTSGYNKDFLLKPQEEVLNQITAWLRRHSFSPEDIAKAEEIWVRYIKKSGNYRANSRTWAAAVIYFLGKIRGHKWLNQAFLAKSFSVSPGGISQRWQQIQRALREAEGREGAEEVTEGFFTPVAAEVFRKLMNYTQTSEKWKNFVGDVFFQFVGVETPPLPIDLILELLIFITCDRTLPGGEKIIDYFIAENAEKLQVEEEEFLQNIRVSRFSLFRVEAIVDKSRLLLTDFYRQNEVEVLVKESGQIEQGDIIMSRIIPAAAEKEGLWRFGGNLVTLRPSAAKELSDLAGKWFWEFSVANKGWATGESFIQENSFRFWRWLIGH